MAQNEKRKVPEKAGDFPGGRRNIAFLGRRTSLANDHRAIMSWREEISSL